MYPPIIGLFSAAAAALGLYGLYWYENLGKEEKAKADQLASQYALSLYSKSLDQLTSQQFDRVYALVKGHFGR